MPKRFSAAAAFVVAAFAASLAPSSVSADYAGAAQIFEHNLDRDQRIMAQIMLAAAGYTNHVPNVHFDASIYKAIRQFESDAGFYPNGFLGPRRMERLTEVSNEKLDRWGFRKVAFPGRRYALWVPLGLGLTVSQGAPTNLTFRDTGGRLVVYMISMANTPARALYRQILAKEIEQERGEIHYKALAADGDWFVVVSKTADGKDRYYRYHQDGDASTGFTLEYDNAVENINAERISVIMSASLGASMLGTPFVDPPGSMGATLYDPSDDIATRRYEARAEVEAKARAKAEDEARLRVEADTRARALIADRQARDRADSEMRARQEADARARVETTRMQAEAEVKAKQVAAEQEAATARAVQQAALAKAAAERAKADAERERLKNVETTKKAVGLLIDKAAKCARDKLPGLVRSGETADVLTSVTMTMCSEDIQHVLDAAADAYKLEHLSADAEDEVIRERIKSELREQLNALSVQAKAGIGVFAPASAN